jgi:hypothetical protein
MNSTLKSDCSRPVLEVFYDPNTCDWDEAIRVGLASHGFRSGQVKVIASPKKVNSGLTMGNKVGKQPEQANIFEIETV